MSNTSETLLCLGGDLHGQTIEDRGQTFQSDETTYWKAKFPRKKNTKHYIGPFYIQVNMSDGQARRAYQELQNAQGPNTPE